jgi:hypothetical protein
MWTWMGFMRMISPYLLCSSLSLNRSGIGVGTRRSRIHTSRSKPRANDISVGD